MPYTGKDEKGNKVTFGLGKGTTTTGEGKDKKEVPTVTFDPPKGDKQPSPWDKAKAFAVYEAQIPKPVPTLPFPPDKGGTLRFAISVQPSASFTIVCTPPVKGDPKTHIVAKPGYGTITAVGVGDWPSSITVDEDTQTKILNDIKATFK